jgi:hypothetical protein
MTRISAWTAGFVAIGLFCSARPASAQQYRMFTDRAQFGSAVDAQSITEHTFEELGDGSYYQRVEYAGLSLRSLDDDPQDLLVISPESYSFPALRSKVLLSNRNFHPMVMDFSTAPAAVGLEGIRLPQGDMIVITVEGTGGTETFEVAVVQGGPQFVGFMASTGSVTKVSVANPPGVNEFIAVDNVCFGGAAVDEGGEDPLGDCLERLSAAIAAGRADGSIRSLGQSLEHKMDLIRAAAGAGRYRRVGMLLRALKLQVRAQRGRKIATARADQLQGLIAECLAAVDAHRQ